MDTTTTTTDANLRSVVEWIDGAWRILAFMGVGVSAELGIPTYCGVVSTDDSGSGGLGLAASAVGQLLFGTPLGFMFRPVDAWWLYCTWLLLPITRAQPNPTHCALSQLGCSVVITQNIDGLHQRAGSHNVIELHGSVATHRHAWTGQPIHIGDPTWCDPDSPLARYVHPNVVLFGEGMPPSWYDVESQVEELGPRDVLLVVGCSCQVALAATLPATARMNGCHIIEVNLAPSLAMDDEASAQEVAGITALRGKVGTILLALALRVVELCRIRVAVAATAINIGVQPAVVVEDREPSAEERARMLWSQSIVHMAFYSVSDILS
jgi:NAD-dependent deacetylase